MTGNNVFTEVQKGPRVTHMASQFTFGKPIFINGERFEDNGDLPEGEIGQRDFKKAFVKDIQNFIKADLDPKVVGFKTDMDSKLINDIELVIKDILGKDAVKAVASILFVFMYLNFHLKSFFIASVGITIIILSFPVTILITEFVLQVKYFGTFHVIVIYIILGIGADDIFVVYDAWV